MSVIGVFTNIGIQKSIDAANNEGFFIKPLRFGVSNQAGDLLPTRNDSNLGLFFDAPVSSRVVVDQNTVKIIVTVPPGVIPEGTTKEILEIYLFAEDSGSNEFLLALGQPQDSILYTPSRSVTLELEMSLVNIDLSENFLFTFTQATEISEHEKDPNSHPEMIAEMAKHGIFMFMGALPFKYRGQSIDQRAQFEGTKAIVSTAGSEVVEFSSTENGTELNGESLVFNGTTDTVDSVRASFNAEHFPFTVEHDGAGTEIPDAQTVILISGTLLVSVDDVVYRDTDGLYKKAVLENTIKSKTLGFAKVTDRVVASGGFHELTTGFTIGSDFYLDATTPGAITSTKTRTRLGIVTGTDQVFLVPGFRSDPDETPMRLSSSAVPDAKLNFLASEIEDIDGAGLSTPPISGLLPVVVTSTIDFQTRITTGATFDITFPDSTLNFYRRVGFTIKSDGDIEAIFSPEVAAFVSLADPGTLFVDGFKSGYIDIQCTDDTVSAPAWKSADAASNIIVNKVGANFRVHNFGSAGTSSETTAGGADGQILVNQLGNQAGYIEFTWDRVLDKFFVDGTMGITGTIGGGTGNSVANTVDFDGDGGSATKRQIEFSSIYSFIVDADADSTETDTLIDLRLRGVSKLKIDQNADQLVVGGLDVTMNSNKSIISTVQATAKYTPHDTSGDALIGGFRDIIFNINAGGAFASNAVDHIFQSNGAERFRIRGDGEVFTKRNINIDSGFKIQDSVSPSTDFLEIDNGGNANWWSAGNITINTEGVFAVKKTGATVDLLAIQQDGDADFLGRIRPGRFSSNPTGNLDGEMWYNTTSGTPFFFSTVEGTAREFQMVRAPIIVNPGAFVPAVNSLQHITGATMNIPAGLWMVQGIVRFGRGTGVPDWTRRNAFWSNAAVSTVAPTGLVSGLRSKLDDSTITHGAGTGHADEVMITIILDNSSTITLFLNVDIVAVTPTAASINVNMIATYLGR